MYIIFNSGYSLKIFFKEALTNAGRPVNVPAL